MSRPHGEGRSGASPARAGSSRRGRRTDDLVLVLAAAFAHAVVPRLARAVRPIAPLRRRRQRHNAAQRREHRGVRLAQHPEALGARVVHLAELPVLERHRRELGREVVEGAAVAVVGGGCEHETPDPDAARPAPLRQRRRGGAARRTRWEGRAAAREGHGRGAGLGAEREGELLAKRVAASRAMRLGVERRRPGAHAGWRVPDGDRTAASLCQALAFGHKSWLQVAGPIACNRLSPHANLPSPILPYPPAPRFPSQSVHAPASVRPADRATPRPQAGPQVWLRMHAGPEVGERGTIRVVISKSAPQCSVRRPVGRWRRGEPHTFATFFLSSHTFD